MFFSCEDEDIGKIKIKIIFPSPSKYLRQFYGDVPCACQFFCLSFFSFFSVLRYFNDFMREISVSAE